MSNPFRHEIESALAQIACLRAENARLAEEIEELRRSRRASRSAPPGVQELGYRAYRPDCL